MAPTSKTVSVAAAIRRLRCCCDVLLIVAACTCRSPLSLSALEVLRPLLQAGAGSSTTLTGSITGSGILEVGMSQMLWHCNGLHFLPNAFTSQIGSCFLLLSLFLGLASARFFVSTSELVVFCTSASESPLALPSSEPEEPSCKSAPAAPCSRSSFKSPAPMTWPFANAPSAFWYVLSCLVPSFFLKADVTH